MSAFRIRPFEAGDANEFFAAVVESQRDVYEWLPWCHPEYTLREAEEWVEAKRDDWEKGVEWQFVITTPGGEFVGGCGLNSLNHDHEFANLGYWVRSSAVRKGGASTAMALVRDWAFANTKLVRLEILAALGNVGSMRAAEKAGALREGTLRNRLHIHGVDHDAAVYSFVRDAE